MTLNSTRSFIIRLWDLRVFGKPALAQLFADTDIFDLVVLVTACGKSRCSVAISAVFVFLPVSVPSQGLISNLANAWSDRSFEFNVRSRQRSFAGCDCIPFGMVEPAVDLQPQEGFVGDLEMGFQVIASGLPLVQ